MDDRELIERAARAAGIDPTARILVENPYNPDFYTRSWDPLDDDGDALRLAVKLGLRVQVVRVHWAHGNPGVEVMRGIIRVFEGCACDSSAYETATRRAIVRAAAALADEQGGV